MKIYVKEISMSVCVGFMFRIRKIMDFFGDDSDTFVLIKDSKFLGQ